MVVTINKSTARGNIVAPPSKSYAHRLLICAALSSLENNRQCIVSNIVLSEDIKATINALIELGLDIIINDTDIIINKKKIKEKDNIEIYCHESGSTFRFFIPILLTTGKKVVVKGTKRLIERGIGPYEKIFKEIGVDIIKEEESITFNGKLKSGVYKISGDVSSQFITGLLFALPLLKDKSEIIVTTKLESSNYVDMTIDALGSAGIYINKIDNCYYINKDSKYNGNEFIVEGDYSNASFLDVFNYLDGNVNVLGLNEKSYQGDKIYKEYFKLLNEKYTVLDISNCIDLGPILFVFASLKYGGHFLNTSRLKIKESDRVNQLKTELEKFGIEVIDKGDEVIIENNNLHKPNQRLNGQNDHRIIMALSIMLTRYGGTIEGCSAVRKSYPNFFDDIKKLGIEVTINDK